MKHRFPSLLTIDTRLEPSLVGSWVAASWSDYRERSGIQLYSRTLPVHTQRKRPESGYPPPARRSLPSPESAGQLLSICPPAGTLPSFVLGQRMCPHTQIDGQKK